MEESSADAILTFPYKGHVNEFPSLIFIIKYDLNWFEKQFCQLFSMETSWGFFGFDVGFLFVW